MTANLDVPAGNTVANDSTQGNFTSTYSIAANDCVPGRVYRVTARGVFSTAATAPTVVMRVKVGFTAIISSPAQAMGASMVNRQWELTADVICQTAGTSGTIEAAGTFRRHTGASASVNAEMSNTAPVTIDTTITQAIRISAQWSVADPANTITMRQFIVEPLGA